MATFSNREKWGRLRKNIWGDGEMAHQLRTLTTLPEDLGSISSIHMTAHNCLYLQDLIPIDIYEGKTQINKYFFKRKESTWLSKKIKESEWYKQVSTGLPETQKWTESNGCILSSYVLGEIWTEKQSRVDEWIFWPARMKMIRATLSGALRKALILKSVISH